jgi:hypothetical protein
MTDASAKKHRGPVVKVSVTGPVGDRAGRQVLAALPAAITLVAALIVGAALLVSPTSPEMARRYERDAERALAARDYETARVCFERLLQSNPNHPAFREGLAVCRSAAAAGPERGSSQR